MQNFEILRDLKDIKPKIQVIAQLESLAKDYLAEF